MRVFGLIGYPLGHSFSKAYFADKFKRERITDAVYENFPMPDISGIGELLRQKHILGFNVTIPHKEAIIPYLDSLSDEARQIGAVNCVVNRGGKLMGYNTDCYGFRESLLPFIGGDRPAALVLGSGGASKAVVFVLRELGISYRIVSTHPEKGGYLSYGEVDKRIICEHRLIVNTTPLGTYPKTEGLPALPYRYLTPEHYLYDLVYNPAVTSFLREGCVRGAQTMNGEGMLKLQAERSWHLFGEIIK